MDRSGGSISHRGGGDGVRGRRAQANNRASKSRLVNNSALSKHTAPHVSQQGGGAEGAGAHTPVGAYGCQGLPAASIQGAGRL